MDSELLEQVQNFRLMDDIFFNAFMQDNPEGMEYILNIIMERDDLKVVRLETQFDIPGIIARGVRFDVFCTDSSGNIYDFEVQNASEGAIPQRARYNSSMLDYLHLQRGAKWEELPTTFVIIIAEHDVLGGGKSIYHIARQIKEMENKAFADGSNIIYVNGEYQDNSSAIGRLIADFHCKNSQEMTAAILAQRMKYLKSDCDEVNKMCKSVEEYANKKAAEVLLRGTINNIKNLMKNANLSAEKAMELLGVPRSDFAKYMALL